MATGGFKSSPATDFLEEWKAKREKMRAKMLGDIAAATGAPLGANGSRAAAAPPPPPPPPPTPPSPPSSPGTDYSSNPGNCHPSSSSSLTRSSSGSALKRPEEDPHHTGAAHSSNPKKAPPLADTAPCATPLLDLPPPPPSSSSSSCNMACNDSDKESPSPGKGKEKKSSGPSARKGKGQIEKRKLREKRRSTGVVSIPSNESLDELGIDDASEKGRREEEKLVQANTCQNEAMTADPATGYVTETPRSGSGRHKSAAQQGSEEDEEDEGGKCRQRHNHQGNLEKRIEELEKELARARQESERLLNAHQDKDDLIGKLKEEIDLLNRDLDDIEDENEQLKQENKTLLKVVGQLTR